jgi:hypothetical protein
MSNSAGFDPHGSYGVIHNGIKVAEVHQGGFWEGKGFDVCTGEIIDERLYIKGKPVGMLSGLTIIRPNDGAFFELVQL